MKTIIIFMMCLFFVATIAFCEVDVDEVLTPDSDLYSMCSGTYKLNVAEVVEYNEETQEVVVVSDARVDYYVNGVLSDEASYDDNIWRVEERVSGSVVCSYTAYSEDGISVSEDRDVYVDGELVVQYNEQLVKNLSWQFFFSHPECSVVDTNLVTECLGFANEAAWNTLHGYFAMLVLNGLPQATVDEFKVLLLNTGGVDLDDYAP